MIFKWFSCGFYRWVAVQDQKWDGETRIDTENCLEKPLWRFSMLSPLEYRSLQFCLVVIKSTNFALFYLSLFMLPVHTYQFETLFSASSASPVTRAYSARQARWEGRQLWYWYARDATSTHCDSSAHVCVKPKTQRVCVQTSLTSDWRCVVKNELLWCLIMALKVAWVCTTIVFHETSFFFQIEH